MGRRISGYDIAKRQTTAALKTLVAQGAHLETQLHIAIVDLLRAAAKPGVTWFHCPNGGKRSARDAAVFRAMGVLAGVPDLIVMQPGGIVRLIEVKTPFGRISAEQNAFLNCARANGFECAVVRSLDEAAAIFTQWKIIKPSRVEA